MVCWAPSAVDLDLILDFSYLPTRRSKTKVHIRMRYNMK
jgi:hypothetical protein